MKEDTVVKINKIGKAGNIIAKVVRILIIIAFVLVTAALIAVTVLPENLVEVNVGTQVGIKVDVSEFGEISPEDAAEIRKGFEEYGKEDMEDGTISNVNVDEHTISFQVGEKGKTFGIKNFIGILILGMVSLVASYGILWFVGALCRAFRDCDSPFDDNVIRRMKNFAFSLIAWAVVSLVSNAVISRIFLGSLTISSGFNVGTILLVLVILGLCGIFRYGAKLQKEHDETL